MLDFLLEQVSPDFSNLHGTDSLGFDATYNPHLITYVSAPCSGGKTHALANLIKDAFSRAPFVEPQRFMYVAPTVDLLGEFSTLLTGLGITDQTTIASSTCTKDVFERVTKHLRSSDLYQATHITLITHATFLRLPAGLRHPERWRIFIDEVPQIDHFQNARLPETRNTLAGCLEASPFTEALVRVDKKQGKSIKKLLEDTGVKGIADMLRKIESPNYTVYTDAVSFDRVLKPTRANFDPEFSLPLLAVINPDIFDGCCFLSANFEESMLYDLLMRNKKIVVPNEELTAMLRYQQYPKVVGQRAHIRYLLDGKRYSKSLRDKFTSDAKRVKPAIDDTILNHLGREKFLLVANKDDKGSLTKATNAERLSGSPQGLNCYQNYTRIVFLSALNRDAKHLSLLREVGFSGDTIQKATLVEAVHQAVMRTALRDPSSKAAVEIIVPDKWTAQELGNILGCANISRLGNIVLNGVLPYTQKDKDRRHDFQKLFKSLLVIGRNTNISSGDDDEKLDSAISLPFLLKDMKKGSYFAANGSLAATNRLNSGISFTLHDTVTATGASEHAANLLPAQDFVRFLRVASRTPISRKDELPLLIPSIFKENPKGGFRANDNFAFSSCLVLDFDGGALSPEIFENIFWHSAGSSGKRSFIICNTFSRTASEPNRFRVIMPFKKPVTDAKVFEAIFDAVALRLEQAGYPKAESKLDENSRKVTQSYYLPCTNRQHKDQAFIRAYGTQTREFDRYAIDPEAYEVTLPRTEPLPCTQTPHPKRGKDDSPEARKHIESAKNKLRSMTSGRHQLFFDLGVLLARKCYYSLHEVERELLEVAGSDPKMKKKARDIMKSLKSRQ
ncbi:protein of unknown function [Hyphomicrobium sp. MC1]|nr:protein of unknown function [Hyphomicrobium sp. MC1]